MIDLSVIIVNYNVKHFLEHCLNSVRSAISEISAEIIVVDNASVDGSVAHVRRLFPKVKIIANDVNLGFSRANNLGIKVATGRYILLLNPDTVVQEKTLISHLNFLKKNSDVGALGTKMLDGSGQFLPESKRGFPTPSAAFFKLMGLNRLFPKSKYFNNYHLGHLDEDQINEVDVLSGAYFFIRKQVLEKIGLLDESFFMYGEDIDLSYRIKQAGYKIIYHPEFPIIHYKGESTKKGSLNYVKHFYQAMIIFAQKHFKKERANILTGILRIGVYVRALFSLIKRFFDKFGWLIVLAVVIIAVLFLISSFWARIYFHNPQYYDSAPLLTNFLLYTSVWSFAFYISELFSRKAKLSIFARNIAISTLILLAVYGLLDTQFRSSRAMLLMGAGASFFLGILFQYFWNYSNHRKWKFGGNLNKKIVVVGSLEESKRVMEIIKQSDTRLKVIGFVNPNELEIQDEFLTHTGHLKTLVEIEKLDEIVFCLKDINIHQVMQQMSTIGGTVEYKIIGNESLSIVGSKSKNTPGEWYSVDIQFNLNSKSYRIHKRIFDFLSALFLLILSPILIIFQRNRAKMYSNIWKVLSGRFTWVSYGDMASFKDELPKLKAGILHPLTGNRVEFIKPLAARRANLLYAKEYHWSKDFEILWKGLFYLGGA